MGQDLGRLLRALPVAVYTTDAEGRITFYNEAATALWGRRPVLKEERWCGSHCIRLVNGEPLPHDRSPVARALKGEGPKDPIGYIERPDGTRTFCRSEVRLVHDAAGKVLGAVNVMIDLDSLEPRQETPPQTDIKTSDAQRLVANLSAREREVFAGIVQGQSTKQIARSLGISPRTVEVHRRNLMSKLQAQSVAELVRLSVLIGS